MKQWYGIRVYVNPQIKDVVYRHYVAKCGMGFFGYRYWLDVDADTHFVVFLRVIYLLLLQNYA